MELPVSIIIPAFNQLEYCKQCIASIQANTAEPYRLILVDNGSTDGLAEFFDQIQQIQGQTPNFNTRDTPRRPHGTQNSVSVPEFNPAARVIHAGENRGFPAGVNLGLAHAEGHVVLLNSDTLVPRGWLGRLLDAMSRSDDVGMVGPMSNYVSGEQLIPGAIGMRPDEAEAFAQDLAQRNPGRLRDVGRLVGFCLLIRDAVVKEVGLLDESFGIGNYEDDDYCLRVRQAGYRLCIAEDCFVFHYGSRTFGGMGLTGNRLVSLLAENQQRLKRKWGAHIIRTRGQVEESEELNRQARDAWALGKTLEALQFLKSAIQACVVLGVNYNDLGAMLWELGERELALRSFMHAAQLDPSDPAAKANLRDAAQALGRTNEFR